MKKEIKASLCPEVLDKLDKFVTQQKEMNSKTSRSLIIEAAIKQYLKQFEVSDELSIR